MTQGAETADAGGGRGDSTKTVHRALKDALAGWTLERALVLAGFVTMALSLVVLASGDLSVLGLSLVLLVPGGVFTSLLLWKGLPWTYLVAGIANSLVAIIAIPFGLLGVLTNPLLGPMYGGFVLAALSLLLALPAGVSGYLQGRRRVVPRPLAEGVHTFYGFAAIALVALSVGALVAGSLAYRNLPIPSSGAGEAIDFTPTAQVSVVTADSRFQPSSFNVTAGIVTRITVLNEDNARHTFTYTVNGTTYNHDLLPGSTTRFLVLFSQPGSVPFRSIPDANMVGTITVVPA